MVEDKKIREILCCDFCVSRFLCVSCDGDLENWKTRKLQICDWQLATSLFSAQRT